MHILNKSQKGEIAVVLTFFSVILMLSGIISGSYLVRQKTNTVSRASSFGTMSRVACSSNCNSNDDGSYHFCYKECMKNRPGYSHSMGCQNSDDTNYPAQWIFDNEIADQNCTTASAKCDDQPFPNKDCSKNVPGPCNLNDKKYDCIPGRLCPTDNTVGVGFPLWCNGRDWYNMNTYGECTGDCPGNTNTPTPPPTLPTDIPQPINTPTSAPYDIPPTIQIVPVTVTSEPTAVPVAKTVLSGSIHIIGRSGTHINIYDVKTDAVLVDRISAQDGTQWTWSGAEKDKTYTIRAIMWTYTNSWTNIESNEITITAPQDNILLTIVNPIYPTPTIAPINSPTSIPIVSPTSMPPPRTAIPITPVPTALSSQNPPPNISTLPPDIPIFPKVYVIIFNPTIRSKGNRTLIDYRRWNNPTDLISNFVKNVKEASYNFVNYQILQPEIRNEIPQRQDPSFQYTIEGYIKCLEEKEGCHGKESEDGANYNTILENSHICKMVNEGKLDELWLFGGPRFGFYESNMTGDGAFWTNGPVIPSGCNRAIHIMGFNYERGNGEVLHDLGHRAEGSLDRFLDDTQLGRTNQSWKTFRRYLFNTSTPRLTGCGEIHFPPNTSNKISENEYDYYNITQAMSDCDGWYNYPNNFSNSSKNINCATWGCNDIGFYTWWFRHFPHYAGTDSSGKSNNWFSYIFVKPVINTSGLSISGSSNEVFQKVINMWKENKIGLKDISDFISQIKRTPSLQSTFCNPLKGECS